MNRFPEIFIKGSPPLKSRILRMRYLGTLPPEARHSPDILPIHALFQPTTDQKEVQTSPESSFMKGFYVHPPPLDSKHPVIKIPSPPLLTTGLLTKAGQLTENDGKTAVAKVVSLRGRSVSPNDSEAKGCKSADFRGKQKDSKRPESVPLPVSTDRTAAKPPKTVQIKGRKSPESSHFPSVAVIDQSETAHLRSTAFPTVAVPKKNYVFKDFVMGAGKVTGRVKGLMAFSPVFGRAVTDEGRKGDISRVVGELFDISVGETAGVKAFHHCESMDYYALVIGDSVPLTACCGAPFLVQFSAIAEARLVCTHDTCKKRVVHSCEISEEQKDRLWRNAQEELSETASKAISMQIQTGSYRSRSLRTEARSRKHPGKMEWLVPAFVDKIKKKRKNKGLTFTNEKLQHIRMRATLVDFRRDFNPPANDFVAGGNFESSRVFTLPKDIPPLKYIL